MRPTAISEARSVNASIGSYLMQPKVVFLRRVYTTAGSGDRTRTAHEYSAIFFGLFRRPVRTEEVDLGGQDLTCKGCPFDEENGSLITR